MVNVKMVNGFMGKKIYIVPQSEVTDLGPLGRWMKDLSNPSDTPGHMGAAPARRTDVF